jgi:ketosteroid isomerase-like protein
MVRSLASKIQAANSALIANGNLDAVGEFFTLDYVVHLTDQDMTGGHDAIRRFLGEIQRAFSHLQVDVEILVEAKDRVAWQRTLRGTHQGAGRRCCSPRRWPRRCRRTRPGRRA